MHALCQKLEIRHNSETECSGTALAAQISLFFFFFHFLANLPLVFKALEAKFLSQKAGLPDIG